MIDPFSLKSRAILNFIDDRVQPASLDGRNLDRLSSAHQEVLCWIGPYFRGQIAPVRETKLEY
jgi:hypothetical protein